MLQAQFEPIARQWLLAGGKYQLSAQLAGAVWQVPVQEALLAHGLTLDGRATLKAIADVFRPRWHWRPDPLFQLWDVVDPPARLLAQDGEDCDGWAMAHSQAIEYALGRAGWRAVIATYYADPWQLSHHFAVAIDPHGAHWVLQPQPSADQPVNQQVVFGPWFDVKTCVDVVASWYGARAQWFDVRTPMWEPLPAG